MGSPGKHLRLTVPLLALAKQDSKAYPATIIREGIYRPAIGNASGGRIRFSAKVLAKIAPTGEGKHVNLDHSFSVKDEVGHMAKVAFAAKAIGADLHLNEQAPRYQDAIGFVEGRLKAGQVPNVSVEIKDHELRPATKDELGEFDFDLEDGVLDGVALVATGACSDTDGCGVGLCAGHASLVDAATPDSTVQPHQGHGQQENGTHMCDQKAEVAALQGKVTALEADLKKERDALAASQNEVKAYETAEVQALTEALQAAAPEGTDLKTIVGESPTRAELAAAVKAVQAMAPKTPKVQAGTQPAKVGLSAGRRTTEARAEATGAKESYVLALRAKHGLPDPKTSKLPRSMQRNTDLLLSGVEAPAQS